MPAVEISIEEATALVLLIWRYEDPNVSHAAPDDEALRTLNNKVVKAFSL